MKQLTSVFSHPHFIGHLTLITFFTILIHTVSSSWSGAMMTSGKRNNLYSVWKRPESRTSSLYHQRGSSSPRQTQKYEQCDSMLCPLPEEKEVIYPVALICNECQRFFGWWKFEFCCRCDQSVFATCFQAVTGMSIEQYQYIYDSYA